MDKRQWLVSTIVTGAALMGLLCFFQPRPQSRWDGAGITPENNLTATIRGYILHARNPKNLRELLEIAQHAHYNQEALGMAAYFFSKTDYQTVPIMETARLAAEADHEIPHLDEIMELLIISNSETMAITDMARKAADGTISEADLVAEIAHCKERADFKTVDDAIKAYSEPRPFAKP